MMLQLFSSVVVNDITMPRRPRAAGNPFKTHHITSLLSWPFNVIARVSASARMRAVGENVCSKRTLTTITSTMLSLIQQLPLCIAVAWLPAPVPATPLLYCLARPGEGCPRGRGVCGVLETVSVYKRAIRSTELSTNACTRCLIVRVRRRHGSAYSRWIRRCTLTPEFLSCIVNWTLWWNTDTDNSVWPILA